MALKVGACEYKNVSIPHVFSSSLSHLKITEYWIVRVPFSLLLIRRSITLSNSVFSSLCLFWTLAHHVSTTEYTERPHRLLNRQRRLIHVR